MYGTSSRTVSGSERNCARATGLRGAEPTVKMPWRYPQRVRRECRAEEGNLSVKGRRTTHRPLLRVRATKLRASASLELARKRLILTERKREAVPPMPMALTVLESVQ